MKPEDRHSERQDVPAGDSLAAEARRHLEPVLEAVTLPERMDAVVALVRWARGGWDDPAGQPGRHFWSRRRGGRLDAALTLLESDAELRRRYQEAVAALFQESDATNAFAHAGIPSERGFFAELAERIMGRLVPRPRNDRDLATLLRRLFRSEGDVGSFDEIPEPLFERLIRLHALMDQPEASAHLRRAFADGFRLLAAWVQAQGRWPRACARAAFRDARCRSRRSTAWRARGARRWWRGVGAARTPVADAVSRWRRDCQAGCREEVAEIDAGSRATGSASTSSTGWR